LPSQGWLEKEMTMSELPTAHCPRCAHAGLSLDTVTVKALLARSLADVTARAYRFCPTPTCPVVYFAGDSDQTFGTRDVREVVYQKAPDDPAVFVCYCFRYTRGQLAAAAHQGAGQAIIAAITAGIKAGACACDLRNPQGACCLGNVRARLHAPPNQTEDASAADGCSG